MMGEEGRTVDCRTCLKYPGHPHVEWCPEGTWPLTMVDRAMNRPQMAVETANADAMPPVFAGLFAACATALAVAGYVLWRNREAIVWLVSIGM